MSRKQYGKVSIGNYAAFKGMKKADFKKKYAASMGVEVEAAWSDIQKELKKA